MSANVFEFPSGPDNDLLFPETDADTETQQDASSVVIVHVGPRAHVAPQLW